MLYVFQPYRAGIQGLMLAFLLFGNPAAAQNGAVRADDDKRHYDTCLAMAGRDPNAGLGVANQWIAQNGGSPAQHCAAVALVGLKRYAEAGGKLDALGQAADVGPLRASLMDQAGNAWLLAGNGPRAVASFQAALTLSANDPDLYADLGRAEALNKNWRGVVADISGALAIAPRRADLLVLRASARQALGEPAAARADLDLAFKLGVSGEAADSAHRLQAALDEAAAVKSKPATVKPVSKPAPAAKKPATPPAR